LRTQQSVTRQYTTVRLRHLTSASTVTQQHMANADGRSCDVRSHVAVADVTALAAALAGLLQQLHVQPGIRAQGRLLGQGRHPRGFAVLLEGVLHVWRTILGEVGVPAPIWRLAQLARLRVDAYKPAQPDQALGLGHHRRPIRAGALVEASGDYARAAHPALSHPLSH